MRAMKQPGDIRGLLDGQRFLVQRPFRSGCFVVMSAVAVLCLLIDAVSVFHSTGAPNERLVLFLGIAIGLQVVALWRRAVRYYSHIRQLYASRQLDVASNATLDLVIRIAAGGLTDLLFYSFGMLVTALVMVWGLLTHFGGH